MTNYIVTIGRNIGDEAMDAQEWGMFRAKVCGAILRRGFTLLTEAVGTGHWDGGQEDSAIWVFTGDGASYLLHRELEHLAYQYEQDAIAWQKVDTVQFVRP